MKSENKILGSDKTKWVRSVAPTVVVVSNDSRDEKEAADALLEEWHEWSAKYRPALGLPGCSPSSRQAQISKQFQSTAEIADDSLRRLAMEQVEWCVDAASFPCRQAIGVEMRNRAAQYSVWRSSSGISYADAIVEILPLLKRRGMITGG